MILFDEIFYIKHYGILDPLEFVELDDMPLQTPNGYILVIREIYGRRNNVPPKAKMIRQYECFDHNNLITNALHCEGWKTGPLPVDSLTPLQIIDPIGEVALSRYWNNISGIIESLVSLRKFTQFKSVQHYNLMTERIRLEASLSSAKKRHNELTSLLATKTTG